MTPRIAIDARPRGPAGLLAEEEFRGRPVLDHLIEQVAALGTGPIAVYVPPDLRHRAERWAADPRIRIRTNVPAATTTLVRTDRLYDAGKLRRAVASGRPTDSAVVWRIDRPAALAHADAEIVRRRTYQPLGRYWAWRPAKLLAERLAPTRIRPNAVTLLAAGFMALAALAIALLPATAAIRLCTALALAIGLVLDTADGHLARLQGTASAFGKWLDAVLDEAADMLLHAAIAYGAFRATNNPVWLAAGMAYGMGKYVFRVTTEDAPADAAAIAPAATEQAPPSLPKSIVRGLAHADIRWHVWIVLALAGGLEWELLFYAAYYPIRAIAAVARRGIRHG